MYRRMPLTPRDHGITEHCEAGKVRHAAGNDRSRACRARRGRFAGEVPDSPCNPTCETPKLESGHLGVVLPSGRGPAPVPRTNREHAPLVPARPEIEAGRDETPPATGDMTVAQCTDNSFYVNACCFRAPRVRRHWQSSRIRNLIRPSRADPRPGHERESTGHELWHLAPSG